MYDTLLETEIKIKIGRGQEQVQGWNGNKGRKTELGGQSVQELPAGEVRYHKSIQPPKNRKTTGRDKNPTAGRELLCTYRIQRALA